MLVNRKFISLLGKLKLKITQLMGRKPYQPSSDIQVIQTGQDVGRLKIPTMIPVNGLGLELGVASGYFSDVILRNSSLKRLYSIDAWADHHNSQEYINCVTKLSVHGNRSVIMRMYFEEAVVHFPDDYFDFIYIDGYAHTGQNEGKIFNDWWPKLKSGGIFSGHDYHYEWPKTVEAVDLFCNDKGKTPIIVEGCQTLNEQDKYDSWYIIK